MSLVTHHADFVERQEKMLLFNVINKVDFRTNVLFCFRCGEWLSAPIFTEDLGVHICVICHEVENGQVWKENKKLDDILSQYSFPCKHYKKGCGAICKVYDIMDHEEECNVVTNAWKDLHCCVCEFKTPGCQDLVDHYKNIHRVITIEPSNRRLSFTFKESHFNTSTGLLFVKLQSNLFALQLKTFHSMAQIQICSALGAIPQFQFPFKCHSCSWSKSAAVGSNLNQLKLKATEISACQHTNYLYFEFSGPFCKNSSLGCLSAPHAEGVDCSFGIVNCCEQSFTAEEHYAHILDKHAPFTGALIRQNALSPNECQYIKVDGNIFRLENNSLTQLYWFGGNWEYTVFVLFEGALAEECTLELSKVHALPEHWDMLYISRFFKPF